MDRKADVMKHRTLVPLIFVVGVSAMPSRPGEASV
jgi:hypothetical protein